MNPPWLVELQKQGDAGEFDQHLVLACGEWTAENAPRALELACDSSLNGRIRWLLLQSVVEHEVTDALREVLVRLLCDENLDPWLLNGVPTVIRMNPMAGHREAVRLALRSWLLRAQAEPEKFRPYHRLNCAVGELCAAFGSFAEPADAQLLCAFVVGPWPHKPFINACEALERVVRRHALTPEVDECFHVHRRALLRRGVALRNLYHVLEYSGAALACWFDLMLARFGPEGDMAIAVESGNPATLRTRLPQVIKRVEKALVARDYPEEWMARARERAAGWLTKAGLKKEEFFR